MPKALEGKLIKKADVVACWQKVSFVSLQHCGYVWKVAACNGATVSGELCTTTSSNAWENAATSVKRVLGTVFQCRTAYNKACPAASTLWLLSHKHVHSFVTVTAVAAAAATAAAGGWLFNTLGNKNFSFMLCHPGWLLMADCHFVHW